MGSEVIVQAPDDLLNGYTDVEELQLTSNA